MAPIISPAAIFGRYFCLSAACRSCR
jgi:hypothetical protein